jgi:nitrate/TMAO reductase-like tetraheme cytochrome c subunit
MMVEMSLRALGLLAFAASGALREDDLAVPAPQGWIGTTNQWAQGLGIVFVVVEFFVLLLLWRMVKREGMSSTVKVWLLVAVAILPLSITFLSYVHGITASETVHACGACHVMKPWVDNLQDPNAETLAAVHYKNRYIQANQCYTCHSDYGLAGTMGAKLEGLGHIYRFTFGDYSHPIKIAHPYPNTRCLHCHGQSQKFLKSDGHPKEDLPNLLNGKVSCLECHGPAHPEQKEGP